MRKTISLLIYCILANLLIGCNTVYESSQNESTENTSIPYEYYKAPSDEASKETNTDTIDYKESIVTPNNVDSSVKQVKASTCYDPL